MAEVLKYQEKDTFSLGTDEAITHSQNLCIHTYRGQWQDEDDTFRNFRNVTVNFFE